MSSETMCDVCQKRSAKTFYIPTGERSMDPSGNGYNDDHFVLNICSECLDMTLAYAMGFSNNPLRKQKSEQLRKRKMFKN